MKMKILKYSIILFLVISTSDLKAQFSIKRLDIFAGYSYQNAHTLEIGIGKGGQEDSWWTSYYLLYLGAELLMKENTDLIYGIKSGLNFTGFSIICTNFQAVYYTDYQNSQFAFRPEIGFGMAGKYSFTYGYNFFVPKNDLNIGNNVFAFRYIFQLKRK